MESKKRVLVMTNALNGGGVERVSATHLRLLQECGEFEVALAICDGALNLEIQYFRFKDFRESAISKLLGTVGFGLNRVTMRDCLKTFAPDIIHIHAYVQFGPDAIEEIMEYKKRANCKVILSHHTYSYICPNDALFNYRAWKVCEKCFDKQYSHIIREACYGNIFGSIGKYVQKKRYLGLFSAGVVDIHIASSSFMKDKLNTVYPSLDILVIYNPCLKQVAQELPNKTQNKIVYFGRMSREKNAVAAVRAVSELPNMRLLLVGDGPEADRIQHEIEGRGVHNIMMHGKFLPQEELYALIKDAEYFILPSVCYESSAPVAAIEALNMGMIPLVSHHGGMRELVQLTHMGYCFDPNDVESIRYALDLARQNHAADVERIETQRNILEQYTEPKYLRDILSLYQTL